MESKIREGNQKMSMKKYKSEENLIKIEKPTNTAIKKRKWKKTLKEGKSKNYIRKCRKEKCRKRTKNVCKEMRKKELKKGCSNR